MSTLHVLFKVADGEYALPAVDVLHMESYGGATKVPGTESHIAGLVQVRNRVVPVIDLRLRFGLSAGELTLDSRVMVVQLEQRHVGLLVDSAREVVSFDTQSFRPPPEVIARQAAGYISAVTQLGPRLIMLMDFKKVIGEEALHGDP